MTNHNNEPQPRDLMLSGNTWFLCFDKGGSKTCGKTGAAAAHAASTQLLRMLRMLRQHECCDCCVSCVKPATDIAHQKTRQLNNSNSLKTHYNIKQVPTETTGARPILHGTGTRKRHIMLTALMHTNKGYHSYSVLGCVGLLFYFQLIER